MPKLQQIQQRPANPEYVLRLQNERQIWQKSKTHFLFSCEKPVWKSVKS